MAVSFADRVARVVRQNATPGTSAIEPETDLLEGGVLDSLGILAVIADLESELGCQIQREDVLPENFRTLVDVARLAEKARRGSND